MSIARGSIAGREDEGGERGDGDKTCAFGFVELAMLVYALSGIGALVVIERIFRLGMMFGKVGLA